MANKRAKAKEQIQAANKRARARMKAKEQAAKKKRKTRSAWSRLANQHLPAISLHLRGVPQEQIARQLGVAPKVVALAVGNYERLLGDVKGEMLEKHLVAFQSELHRLIPDDAHAKMYEKLCLGPKTFDSVRLGALDRVAKLKGYDAALARQQAAAEGPPPAPRPMFNIGVSVQVHRQEEPSARPVEAKPEAIGNKQDTPKDGQLQT